MNNSAIHPQSVASPTAKNNRDFNLDILRIIALVGVPLVHFFLNTGFYELDTHGVAMCISLCLRNLGYMCIPLFLLLTGYLQGNKTITVRLSYYVKILKFIVPYLLIVTIQFFFAYFFKNSELSLKLFLRGVTSYPGYSWYVEMYIGLFMLIPFLNIIWQGLKTKRQEHILLVVVITLSILPTFINVFDFGEKNWWSAEHHNYIRIIPEFWISLYPIAFYFTGAYLSKHREAIARKIKPIYSFLLFALSFALFSLYCIVRCYNTKPSIYAWLGRNSFGQMVCAVFLTIFIASVKFNTVPTGLRKFSAKLSDLSFSAYLLSYIADTVFYRFFNGYIKTYNDKLYWLPIAVITVTVASYIMAFIVDLAAKQIIKYTEKLIFFIGSKAQRNK